MLKAAAGLGSAPAETEDDEEGPPVACIPFALALTWGAPSVDASPALLFRCEESNDLYRAARANGVACARFDSDEEAVASAPEGSGLLLLADSYPEETAEVSPETLRAAQGKGVRVFVEYPGSLPGVELGPPQATQWERAVVASDWFGPELPALRILAIHGCRYVPIEVEGALTHIAIARVAGYDEATFGLPDDAAPALVELPGRDLLVATTGLSCFVRGRYGPTEAWSLIWRRILAWLAPGAEIPDLTYTPTVRPSYGPDERVPADLERETFRRAVAWYYDARLLIHESWLPHQAPSFSRGIEEGPMLPSFLPRGDGSHGLLEGFSAPIDHDGSQRHRLILRNDCLCESAMALAFAGRVSHDARSAEVGSNLADYVCFDSLIRQGVRSDPNHPAYGLMAWGITSWAWERAFYGDDNARALLGLMATSALTGSDRWDDAILRCLLANLRTTGSLGFRGGRIDIPDLEANGWRFYNEREIAHASPHYESYLWACYLWAYRATGYRPFLEKAEAGIRGTMEVYPDAWLTTYGLTIDRSRMLLCLAWLVRTHDTPEHREWLTRIADDLLREQDASGAIREVLGDPAKPQPPGVPSNEAYGTAETPLIQENGDPACDMLYSMNFAFLGLHEAAAATGDPNLRAAEDRIAEFLCRIQVRSETHPELDGAWFRSFDFEKWEFWGSSADIGWGAWCIESGWTQGWIASVLGMRQMDTSLWDLTADVDLRPRFDAVVADMARTPGGPYVPEPALVPSIAVGRPYALSASSDARYPGQPDDLTDGLGWPANAHTKWLGWMDADLSATVDLGSVREVSEAGARFLADSDIGVYPPTELRVSVSEDGREFREVGVVSPKPTVPGDRAKRAEVVLVPVGGSARFVRVEAMRVRAVPAWHAAAGQPAWLFSDEVVVR